MKYSLLMLALLASTAHADTWTVDDDGKADFDNIQAAVDAARGAEPIAFICDERFSAVVDGYVLPVAYCSSLDLSNHNDSVTRLIIVAHPSGQESFASVEKMVVASSLAGVADETLVISPQFPYLEDVVAHGLENEILFWNSSWRWGQVSSDFNPPIWPAHISSFDVIDQMVLSVLYSGNFPNIESIVVTGHSAGGQVAGRYAVISRLEDEYLKPLGIDITYVVFAPSSYGYLDNRRRVEGTTDTFEIPDTSCTYYDWWGYGLDSVYSALPFDDPESTRDKFEERRVAYITGELDYDPNHSSLDTSCYAMLQGNHRLERTEIHYNHLQDIFGSSITCSKHFLVVPDVGHSEQFNFSSDEARPFLFGAVGLEAVTDQLITYMDMGATLDVMVNDTIPECSNAKLTQWDLKSEEGGAITSCGGGCLLYTTPLGFIGNDVFAYTIENEGGVPSTAQVQVHVLGDAVIQPMIDAANNGDVIFVPAGIYYEAIDFNGKAIELRSSSGPAATVIDNLERGTTVTFDSGEGAGSILDGFTIRGGSADQGGGVHVTYSSPTLRNCIFTDNHARRGAGVRTLTSYSIIENCIFEGNVSTGDGAGMRASGGGSVQLTNCVFTENISGDDGGGFASYSSQPILNNCHFELNRAGDRGGAIRLGISQAEITNSTFEENYAAYLGGGIHAWYGSTVQISSNNFHNNFALDGAAIFILDDGSSGTVSENSFCGNHVNDLSGNWTDGGGNTITDECPPDCPDINGDGYVNVTDILAVIADWGSTDSPADVIQDGIVDVSDVLLVISNWGPCE
jgi:hypothetical protein